MNKFILAALVASVSAVTLQKADLPYNADLVEKLDPLSRYVNDENIVQLKSNVKPVNLAQKADLPYNPDLIEKLDPVSRYVNDENI